AEINELRRLRFADDQLCAVLDFLVVIGKAVRQRVARVVGPLDDVDELLLDEIQDRQSPALRRFPVYRQRYFGATATFFAASSAVAISFSICGSGSAPGISVPSAKINVGVALIFSELPSACVLATGSPQSPLLSGSLPDAKNVSQALALSAEHQICLDLCAAFGCNWSIGNRNV